MDFSPIWQVLFEKGNLDTDRHARKTSCGNEDRDWGDESTGQGITKISGKAPGKRRKAWNGFSSQLSEEHRQASQHLDLGCLAFRTVRR